MYANPTPVAARSKVWVCGHALPGIIGSNPVGGVDVRRLRGTGQSLVQRSPTECGVSECDLKTSTVRRP